MKIYEKTWFIIVMLIVFFPVGLFFMWKYSNWNKVVKIIISVIFGLMLIVSMFDGSSDDKKPVDDKQSTQQEQQVDQTEPEKEDKQEAKEEPKEEKEEETIEYTEITVDELYDALEKNAVNASDAYKGGYYAVTGKLSNIDASGDYISLTEMNDEYSFNSMNCYIKSDEQLERVKQLSKGDTVTVRGKIKDVGEILGYSLDIDSID